MNPPRTRFQASLDKRNAMKKAEEQGEVADSIEVRTALMAKFHSGECTLEEIQSQLAAIKRGAKKRGLKTRSQAFREG